MKKKLLFWEVVMSVVMIGVFVVVFASFGGRESTGRYRYFLTIIASISVIVVSLISLMTASDLIKVVAFIGIIAEFVVVITNIIVIGVLTGFVFIPKSVLAGSIVVSTFAIVFAWCFIATTITGNKKLKSPFLITSLVIEGVLISVITLLIIYWPLIS